MMGLPLDLNIGSCEYDVDFLLNAMERFGNGFADCSPYDCKLPIPAGKYGTEAFEILIPAEFKLPFMAAMFLEGKIAAHVSVISDGKEIICADVSIDITA